MTDKTLLLYDSWQVLHTVVNVVRFTKGIFFVRSSQKDFERYVTAFSLSLSQYNSLEPELL